MTEIEVKALALVNAHAINRRSDLDDARHTELRCALLDAVQSQAAAEARHAAELREQAERFDAFRQDVSDAVEGFWNYCRTTNTPFPADLDPFILPSPDPLVEAVGDALEGQGMGRPSHTTTEITARLRSAIEACGGKIVWEAGE